MFVSTTEILLFCRVKNKKQESFQVVLSYSSQLNDPNLSTIMETLQNYINGAFVASASTETTTILNPSTGQAIAVAPQSNQADVDAAMTAAAHAFDSWKETTPGERQLALLQIADLIEANASALIDIECQNTGKPKHLTASEEIPVRVVVPPGGTLCL